MKPWWVVVAGFVTLGAGLSPLALAGASAGGVDFAQCANGSPLETTCNWTNGNLNLQNSTYHEGDATTQVVEMSGLVAGAYTLSLEYSTIFKSQHSYDFLTNYNESNTFLGTPKTVCSMAAKSEDVAACSDPAVSVTSTPIVQDSGIAGTVGSLSAYASASYRMIGGFLVSAGAPSSLSVSNGEDAQVAVHFVVGGTGAQATTGITSGTGADTTYTAYLLFGAHVANETQWGLGTGAASISGSPYHVSLVSLLDAQGVAAAGVGGQDNQMQGALLNGPAISLAKSAAPVTYTHAGESTTYTYVITNDGDVALPSTQYSVTDDHVPSSPFACGAPTALSVGNTVSCTATYAITNADVTSGSVTNVAIASGGGLSTGPARATVTYASTSISLAKSAAPVTYTHAGESITYTYVITNDGDVALPSTQYSVTDDHVPSSPFACGAPTALAPGASVSCTASYVVTSDDVVAKSVTNVATASGGELNTAPASATVHLAAIGLAKSASPSSFSAAGESITYTYTITNVGGAALASTQYSVTDDHMADSPFACGSPTALGVGESVTCTHAYVTTSADVEGESVTNVATASGGGLSTAPASATVTYSTYGIALAKSAVPSTYTHAGESITYTYTITNDGSVALPLTQYSVSDDKIGTFACGSPTALGVGESVTCTHAYVTTSADVASASVTNVATASGGDLSTGPATTTVNLTSVPVTVRAITLAKSAAPVTYTHAGESITYTYTITNTGNLGLGPTQFSVIDDKVGTFDCGSPNMILNPGASLTCTATYTVTDADVAAGSVTNVATASGAGLSTAPATATVHVSLTAGIGLSKSASPGTYAKAGDVITYTYVITNTASAPLTSAQYSVSDDRIGTITCGTPIALGVGEALTCTANYTVTDADVAAGSVTNVATASGGGLTSPSATATVSWQGEVTTTIHVSPGTTSTVIPSDAPGTGAGGAAHSSAGPLLGLSALLILLGLALMGVLLRRRQS